MATIRLQKRDVSLSPASTGKPSHILGKDDLQILLGVCMAVVILGTSFFYLSEFNSIASQGVLINDLERERSQLIIQNEVWNMRIARLKSLDVIEQQDVVKRMSNISPDDLDFVDLDKQ